MNNVEKLNEKHRFLPFQNCSSISDDLEPKAVKARSGLALGWFNFSFLDLEPNHFWVQFGGSRWGEMVQDKIREVELTKARSGLTLETSVQDGRHFYYIFRYF